MAYCVYTCATVASYAWARYSSIFRKAQNPVHGLPLFPPLLARSVSKDVVNTFVLSPQPGNGMTHEHICPANIALIHHPPIYCLYRSLEEASIGTSPPMIYLNPRNVYMYVTSLSPYLMRTFCDRWIPWKTALMDEESLVSRSK